MYAGLVSAGASQLYDLYKSVTGSRSSSTPDTSSPETPAPTGKGAVNTTSSSGASLSTALQKLFVDLQASTSSATSSSATSAGSTDPTSTIANDLQTVSNSLKASGHHGHHHGGPPPGDDDQSTASAGPTSTSSTTSKPNPFGNLASSLLAYTKSQSLSATSSTAFTA